MAYQVSLQVKGFKRVKLGVAESVSPAPPPHTKRSGSNMIEVQCKPSVPEIAARKCKKSSYSRVTVLC